MSKEKEIWKTIEEFPNYEVSSLGRVRSKERIIVDKDNKRTRVFKSKVLKPGHTVSGYETVGLIYCNNKCTKMVHRLVAETFIPNPKGYPQVNHIDENKQNNTVDNLEWCSVEYNINYGSRNELVAKTLSKPVLQYTLDGKFVREWTCSKEVSEVTGFSYSSITSACRSGKKSHSFLWCYKKTA